jgi:hypothetical protein
VGERYKGKTKGVTQMRKGKIRASACIKKLIASSYGIEF